MVDHKELSDLGSRLSAARLLLVLSLAALAIAGAAWGQPGECANSPRSVFRFENCGFDSGIAGWSNLEGRSATSNLAEGIPSPGSYQIESIDDDEGDRGMAIVSPCVLIAPSSTYELEAQFKIVDPNDAVQCGVFMAGYSSVDCSGPENGMDSAEIRVTGSEWASLPDTYVSRSDDASMEVFAFCYEDASGPTFTILIDNFIADGPASGSPLFSDGFESGDTSAWSKTVP